MSQFLYDTGIRNYGLLIRLAAKWNPKARLWIEGRKSIFDKLNNSLSGNQSPIAWFHCASLGEFEQARPVIEAFKVQHPAFKIFLTFFSPSGYEVRKSYPGADYIFYLPLDTAANAKRMITLVKPSIAFFAKYEFWYHYIEELKKQGIPSVSFSAIFRKEQIFFTAYGGFYRKILRNLSHIFVQNQLSKELLHSINIQQVTVAGDTRFDRVKTICDQKKDLPIVKQFKSGQKLLVIGSSWPQDMAVLVPFLNSFPLPLKIIIAPHEMHEDEINHLQTQLQQKSIRFSQVKEAVITDFHILIIDNIGMLSSLYQFGEFAYIGGAFGKGLHNILEAATFGMPIFFGPNYQKFQEAKDLVSLDAAISINNSEEFTREFTLLYNQEDVRQTKASVARQYVQQHTGATQKILSYCKQLLPQE